MHDVICPGESQFFEEYLQDLEMIILFVANHIDVGVKAKLFVTADGSTQILGHIHRCSVCPEQQLMVQSFRGKIAPYRTVLVPVKDTVFQSLDDQFPAQKVCIGFIIDLIKGDAHPVVGLFKSLINPSVHFFPQVNNFFVTLLPFYEHRLCLTYERGFFQGLLLIHSMADQFPDLFFVLFLKEDIKISYQVVSFFPSRFRGGIESRFLPGQHGFANMYSPVIDQVYLNHLVAVGLQYPGHRPAQ